jgi:hypothetical protein
MTINLEAREMNISSTILIITHNISLEEVKKSDEFEVFKANHINLGFDAKKSIWLKIKLENLSNKNMKRYLVIDNPLLENVFFFDDKNDFKVHKSGMLHVANDRQEIFPSYAILIKPNEKRLVYIQIQNSTTTLQFGFHLKDKKTFKSENKAKEFSIVLFIGLLSAFVVYSLFLYMYTKDKSYYLYSFYLIALMFQQLTYIGFLPLYTPASFVYIDNLMVVPKVSLMIITGILFAKEFLKMEEFPRLNRIYKIIIIIVIIQMPIFGTKLLYIPEVTVFIGLLFIIFNTFSGVYVYLSGNRQARFFIVGWVFLFIGYLLMIFDALGLLSIMHNFPELILWITVIEALFLMLAFVDKLNILTSQKNELDKKLFKELSPKLQNRIEDCNLILYVIASALAAYNHHFSLLFAFIVGVSAVFFIDKKRVVAFALAGVSIFVLYIPHLPIFFSQLAKGGVGGSDGWLGAPEPDFLWQYIRYIFNYSWGLLIAVFLVFGSSYAKAIKTRNHKLRLSLLFLLWFLIPFIIAYYYSIYFNPVIQYSVLIFSFPFFLLLLFAFIIDLSNKGRIILIAIVTPILLYTTIFERHYFQLFYHSAYKEVVVETIEFSKDDANEKRFLLDSHKQISNYYLNAYNFNEKVDFISDFNNYKSLIDYLENDDVKSISYGMEALSDPVIPFILNNYFPYVKRLKNYNQGNFYIFSKENKNRIQLYKSPNFACDFESDNAFWNFDEANISRKNSNDNHVYHFKDGQEWGVSFELPLDSMNIRKNDLIDISFDVFSYSTSEELLLVSELLTKGEKVDWRSTSSKEFDNENAWSGSYTIYHSIKLSDISIPKNDVVLKVYAWNKGKTSIDIDNLSVKVRVGNPFFYGLLKEIE